MSKPRSEYLFVEVAAQRCLQLMRGARPKLESGVRKYTTLAVQEVDGGLVPWKMREDGDAELVAAGLNETVGDEADDAGEEE